MRYYLFSILLICAVSVSVMAGDGTSVLNKKCGMCHDVPDPGKYSKKEWKKWVGKMAPKASLSADDKKALMKLR